jgi:hypothetical protein
MRRMVGECRPAAVWWAHQPLARHRPRGAWICANWTQYVSDESQPPGALLPRTRLWYLLTHARTCLGRNAERVQSVALRCEILLLC